MKTEQTQGNGKVHNIQEALDLLNAAAEDSADRIRGLVTSDYKNLIRILAEAKPEIKTAAGGLKQATVETVRSAKDRARAMTRDAAHKVDGLAHENAWTFLGVAAALATIMGFMLGRKLTRITDA